MWFSKKELKTSYYRSFFALIVIPILVIIIASSGMIKTMMRESAIQNIQRAQDNIISTLSGEVKDVSLRLSHFIYVNDNEIMKTAARTDTDDPGDRYYYMKKLTESFNYAMVPVQDILSAVFYMKDGGVTYMKDNILLEREELQQARWYQEALAEKNIVKVGFYDTNVTSSRQTANSFTIVAALAPGIDVDRDRAIEMTALFVSSQAGALIRNYNKEKLMGTTMILDGAGTLLFDATGDGELLPAERSSWKRGIYTHNMDGGRHVYAVSVEPVTGCRIVTVIDDGLLTRDFNRIAGIIIMVTVLLFALFYGFSYYFLKSIVEPVHNVVEGMEMVEEGILDVHVEPSGQAEIRTMVDSFNSMVRRLKHLIEENEEQQKRKHDAEIRALQSQINPHFLVNSLNSIRFMAQVSKFDGIRKMAEALIKILSTSFRSNSGFHTVQQELDVLDGFVYLMKIRYSDGFDVAYQVEEDCRNLKIPRLILQPVVENSIVHGFSQMVDEMGLITVSVKCREETLLIEIRDNGKGMSEQEIARLLTGTQQEEADHASVGVTNVKTRLELNYGEACEVLMESQVGSYTLTTIKIPVRPEENQAGERREYDEEGSDSR